LASGGGGPLGQAPPNLTARESGNEKSNLRVKGHERNMAAQGMSGSLYTDGRKNTRGGHAKTEPG